MAVSKKVTFDKILEKLLIGVNTIANAVATSLGPRGRNVGIDRGFEQLVVHDGVTIAESITLKDPEENFAAQIIKQASQKQVKNVGDGTTVTMILAQAIFAECVKMISTGINAMSLIKGLEQGSKKLIAELEKISQPIKTLEEKIQIATVSAEDDQLGEMIGTTLDKIGTDGIITVEVSKSADTIIEHQEGMQFDQGYISHLFVTDTDKMEATVENTFVLLSDRNVSNILELKDFLDKFVQVSKELVIIAPDVTDSALQSFIITKLNGGMSLNCVKAPSAKSKEWLEDIAILTGGTVIRGDAGMKFENIEIEQLGRAQRITSTKDTTLIVGGMGDKEQIEQRVQSLRGQLEKEESAYEQEKLRERIAKLSSGVAVIKVGGYTEIEWNERKERAIDSVAATKAAITDGIIPGGEIAYLNILNVLSEDNVAEQILKRALQAPFRKLVSNAGYDPGEKLAEVTHWCHVGDSDGDHGEVENPNRGFDVTDGEFKDMIASGIIDPTKVAKSAIANAVSVAIQLMSVDVLITDIPEEKK